ncbi:MAG: hypothetical protein H0A75_02260 [Candidatus Methanofishera endochildressiae]|uniref:YqaJ viral recombinase domain-containing protein n=1 Tax=Candidatus Methanofishera endochildressiae TaxID=2738884 RepID=A0A7Z0MMX1_9GAMM|nr:hypothetical protein [Candidatus Methanofishera endochildressiae]
MFISADENWLSASPDGIINCDTLLEIKSPFRQIGQIWMNLLRTGNMMSLKI